MVYAQNNFFNQLRALFRAKSVNFSQLKYFKIYLVTQSLSLSLVIRRLITSHESAVFKIFQNFFPERIEL
jgi:hypothetical protein